MKYFNVTFKWYDSDVYCSNMVKAETKEIVEKSYSLKYEKVTVREATECDVETARMKSVPFFTISA